jgi:hypothetical protein
VKFTPDGVSDEPPHAKSTVLTQMISREFKNKLFDFFTKTPKE